MKNIALLVALSIACVAASGCGNKGPLVRPSEMPAATPVTTPSDAEPVVDPDVAPAAESASGAPVPQR